MLIIKILKQKIMNVPLHLVFWIGGKLDRDAELNLYQYDRLVICADTDLKDLNDYLASFLQHECLSFKLPAA